MAEGAAWERRLAAVAADESRRPRAGERLADERDGDAGRRPRRFERRARLRRDGRQEFIIVAAGGGNVEERGVGHDRRPRGGRKRQALQLDARGDAADAQHLGEIADETVGNVHAGVGEPRHRRRHRETRLRLKVAIEEMAPMRFGELGPLPQPQP